MIRILSATAALALLAACQTTGSSVPEDAAQLNVAFADAAWNGNAIPSGQHCGLQGGQGATPAMTVEGVPETATEIIIEYNDESYAPLAYDGGHGKLAHIATAGTTSIPSVPGNSGDMPEGARIVASTRATGNYSATGYLPPCSGGKGNLYSADVKAVDAEGKIVAFGKITLGRY